MNDKMYQNRLSSLLKVVCSLFGGIIYLSANAQSDQTLTSISKRVNDYSDQHAQEKVFVHTDKSFYIVGEILWCKLYVVDALMHQPVRISKLAYAELLDSEGKLMVQSKIMINTGLGSGSIQIPMSLKSGRYVLRAYTSWMKNDESSCFFEKPVTIINALKPAKEQETVQKQDGFDAQFFPEGGNMLSGVPNKIAFKVVDQYGKGLDFEGSLVDSHDNVIQSFKPTKFGIGNFVFTPKEGEAYTAQLHIGSQQITRILPPIYSVGYSMQLSERKNDLRIMVSSRNIPSSAVFLIVHTNQKVKVAMMQLLSDDKAIFNISKDKLGEGISGITLFNSNQKPVCERLYFKRPSNQLKLSVNPDKNAYESRQKVLMNINSKTDSSLVPNANMSVSVFKNDSLQEIDQEDISSYLWLSADLRGNIETPSYYFLHADDQSDQAIDNLMLTHGWRKFNWDSVLQPTIKSLKFLPEYEGHIVTGIVTNKITGAPEQGVTVYLSSTGKAFKLAVARSDEHGIVKFNIGDIAGSEELIIQTNSLKDNNCRVVLQNPFSENPVETKISSYLFDKSVKNQLLQHSINAQVQEAFVNEKAQRFGLPAGVDTLVFYGKPEKEYLLDDYTRFRTMEEVLREYVPEVNVSKRQKNYYFNMVTPKLENLEKDPLTLVDGVPFFNPDTIIAIDPLRIRKIAAIPRVLSLGHLTLNGVVNFSTYNNDLGGISLDPNALVVEYEGLQLQRQFYSPVYETESQINSRIPDLRNVLYWNPNVNTNDSGNASLQFFTGDEPGNYAVVIHGITKDGKTGSQISYFKVKNRFDKEARDN